MPNVELIYDRDCPNVPETRRRLLQAFSVAGQTPRWTEWARGDAASPAYAERHASPTVMVDGVDACPGTGPSGAACRLYADAEGRLGGAPSVHSLAEALRSAPRPPRSRQAFWLVSAPALLVALLPKLACPLCWPAYAALLAAVGLGFLVEPRYLLPVSLVAFALLLAALGMGAGSARRAIGLVSMGGLSAAGVLVGKFVAASDLLTYAGAAGLFAACLIRALPSRGTARPSCCVPSSKGEKQA